MLPPQLPRRGASAPRPSQLPNDPATSGVPCPVGGITGITDFGHAWTWVAFTGWLLALAGLFRHGWPVLRGQRRPAVTQEDVG
jgi:hypothetical protein